MYDQLLRSRAEGESHRSDPPCLRYQQMRFENGLIKQAKNAQIIFSPDAEIIGLLIR